LFTRRIETIGEIAEVKPTPAGFRVRLKTDLSSALTPGDSLAVNGVCLTVVSADPDGVNMDVSPETIRVSALGSLKRGDRVNLERPMRADARGARHPRTRDARGRARRRPLRPGARRRHRDDRGDPQRRGLLVADREVPAVAG